MNILSTRHSTNILSVCALTPYATLKPRESLITNIPKKETYNTLFSFDNEKQEQIQKNCFNTLNKYLYSMYDLQTKNLFPPENQNLHQDNLNRFLHLICDPSISIAKLIPVPLLTTLEFPILFHSYLFSFHVPPDRATWVIHVYLSQSGMTRDELTKFIKTFTEINPKDNEYFIKLVHSMYTKNLLNHLEIIKWLIENFQPSLLKIFKIEIFKSFKILSFALNSPNYLEYLEMMEEDELINKPSQIIQLAISTIYSSNEFKERFQKNIFTFMNEPIKKRASLIIKGIKNNNVSLFIKTYLILSLNFPHYDIPHIINEFQILFQFISKQEKEKYIMETIPLIHDFPSEPETISAVLIELYKILNNQNDIQFPLKEFIDFLYSNIQFIDDYTYFFYELQFQGIIEYLDFLSEMSHNCNYISNFEATFHILLNLPPLKYSKLIVGKVRQILLKNSELFLHYEKVFNECITDIEKNYDYIFNLPPYFVYMTGYLIMENKKFNFIKKSQLLAQLNLQPLIFSEFEKEENPSFSLFSVLQMKHFIPLLYSRGILNKFLEIITNEKNANKYFDICRFLNDTYMKNSSYLKDYKEKIQTIVNKKISFINTEKISQLAYDYSHLCNVFILNNFYEVKTIHDFQKLFSIFLKNLLTFESLCVEHLWDYFVSFTESLCISFPFQFFINMFLMISIFGTEITENNKTVITRFVSLLIKKKFFSGSEFLNAIYKIVGSKRIDINDCENANILLDILASIIEKMPKLFTFTNLIQNSIANWLTISNRHLRNIIKPLSSNPIIITQNIVNTLHAPPSNYGAIFFYLLPNELFDYENENVFDFYFKNITYNTMLLWTIWLKNRPLYKIEKITDEVIVKGQKIEQNESIVLPNYLFNEYTDNYRFQISNYFLNITSNPDGCDPNMMDIYLESFRILCDHQKIAKITFDMIINELNRFSIRFSMDSIRLTFYLLPYLNEKQVEVLCKSLLKFDLDLIFEDDSFIFKNGYFLLIIFSRFAKDTKLDVLMETENKILQFIPEIYENQFQSTQFLIDCFNFYVSITSSKEIQFHNQFMEIIKTNLSKIKGKLKNCIILNQNPKIFNEMEEPLYINSLPSSSSSISTEFIPGTNQMNDIFADDGYEWF